MKDYTLSRNEAKDFITSYDILNADTEERRIVANHPNGEPSTEESYSEENMKGIIDKMEDQVEKYGPAAWNYHIKRVLTFPIASLLSLFFIGAFIYLTSIPSGLTFVLSIIDIPFALTSIFLAYESTNSIKTIKDIEKHEFYLNNKRLFKEKITDSDGLLGVKKDTVRLLMRKTPNINDIENMTYSEVKHIASYTWARNPELPKPVYKKRVRTLNPVIGTKSN